MTPNTTPELSILLCNDLTEAEALSCLLYDVALLFTKSSHDDLPYEPLPQSYLALTFVHGMLLEKIENVSKAIEAHLHNRIKGKEGG